MLFPVRWHEPFGLAITESLYFGCPVFGTPYGSLTEIVTKDIGYLSASKNELAEALQYIDQYDRKRCHERVMDQFTATHMMQQYLQKYEIVLNGHTLNHHPPVLKEIQDEKFLPFRD
jgi:glycosyltransferase involved in cell wall biosynthesis